MAGVSLLLARTWLRRSVAASVLLACAAALAAGAPIAAFTGALRSGDALDRFLAAHQPATARVGAEEELPAEFDYSMVETLPGVRGAARGAYGLMSITGPNGREIRPGTINPFITSSSIGDRVSVPIIVEGRDADPAVAGEVTIDEYGAELLGASAGDTIELALYAADQIDELFGTSAFPPPRGEVVEATIVGLHRTPMDLNPEPPEGVDAVALASSELYLGPAFWARYGPDMAAYGGDDDGTEVLLAAGDGAVEAFEAGARALPGGSLLAIEATSDASEAIENARATVRLEAAATLIFGLLAVAAAGTVVGQATARQVRSELQDRDVLDALGVDVRSLRLAVLLRMAPVAVVATVGAVASAWLFTSWTPIGLGGRAEISPGPVIDPRIAAPGGLAVLVGFAAGALLLTRRRSGSGADEERSVLGRLRRSAAGLGGPTSISVGLAQLSSRGGAPVPVRSSLGGAAVGVAGVVAAAVFSASLTGFVDDPAKQGWAWDFVVGDSDDPELLQGGTEMLDSHPAVTGYAVLSTGVQSLVDVVGVPRDVKLVGLDSVTGDVGVPVVAGRAPAAADEIMLGSDDLAAARVEVGSRIEVRSGTTSEFFTVVGSGLMHQGMFGTPRVDRGAFVTDAGLRRLFASTGGTATSPMAIVVEAADGADLAELGADLADRFGPTVIPFVPTVYADGLSNARDLPLAFAALVGVLGAGNLVHLGLLLARRRRAQLAVLATLGAVRRQIVGVCASAASAVALGAVVVGVPVGLVVGRWAWRLVGQAAGAPAEPAIPALVVMGVAGAVFVVANGIAVAFGRSAAGASPGTLLRTE